MQLPARPKIAKQDLPDLDHDGKFRTGAIAAGQPAPLAAEPVLRAVVAGRAGCDGFVVDVWFVLVAPARRLTAMDRALDRHRDAVWLLDARLLLQ